MGVEYRHYLVPGDRGFRPDPPGLARLVAALRDSGFIPPDGASPDGVVRLLHDGGEARPWVDADLAATAEGDRRLAWSVEDFAASGLADPFGRRPGDDSYYDLEIHLAGDYVAPVSESIEPIADPTCGCGRDLAYEAEDRSPFAFTGRIRLACPDCGSPFRPGDHAARMTDPATGAASERPGGSAYRFALAIDCGKAIPFGPPTAPGSWRRLLARLRGREAPGPSPARASEALHRALVDALGVPFEEFGTLY